MIRYGFLVVLLAVSLNAIGSETDINLKNLCKNQTREGLNTLYSDIKVLEKQYDYLTFIQWGDLNKNKTIKILDSAKNINILGKSDI